MYLLNVVAFDSEEAAEINRKLFVVFTAARTKCKMAEESDLIQLMKVHLSVKENFNLICGELIQ